VLVSPHAATKRFEGTSSEGQPRGWSRLRSYDLDTADARGRSPERSVTVGSDLRASAADRTLSFSFRLFAPIPKRRDEEISERCAWNALLALNGFRVWTALAIRREFLCRLKSWTRDSTVMVHGVVWWFSGGGNWRFDNACYVTHEGR
jgi:hypothetical protein